MAQDYHNSTTPGASQQQNQYMARLLRSPEHGRVSDRILLLTFTGRKTGNQYSTPLSYMEQGETLVCFSDSTWAWNLAAGAPVTLVLRGAEVQGHAQATRDPLAVRDGLRQLARKDADDVKYFGVTVDSSGRPDEAALERAAQHNAMITIRLQ